MINFDSPVLLAKIALFSCVSFFLALVFLQAPCRANVESVTLAWDANAESDLVGYKIYYDAGSNQSGFKGSGLDQGASPITITRAQLDNSKSPYVTLSGVSHDQTYQFAVAAYNQGGVESGISNIIRYDPPAPIHTVTTAANPLGAISPAGPVSVEDGNDLAFTITADPHCHVVDVQVDGTSHGAVTSLTIENIAQDHDIQVIFEQDFYEIVTANSAHGTISPAGPMTAFHGSTQTFTFTPDPNCHVVDVMMGGVSKGAITSLTIESFEASLNLYAVFEKNTYSISATSGSYGSISPAGVVTVAHEAGQTFTITPAQDCEIIDVRVDGQSVGVVTAYTFTDVIENHSIDAQFAPLPPQLVLEAGNVAVTQDWRWVGFQNSYKNPVVVSSAMSTYDPSPAVVRIEDIYTSGFNISVQEWDYLDGMHGIETTGYVVVEAGIFDLADGTRIQAGKVSVGPSGLVIPFSTPFQTTPVVIASVTSNNDLDAVTVRLSGVSANGFYLRLQQEEGNGSTHASETVSFVAWEPSQGTVSGVRFDVGKTSSSVTHKYYPVSFSPWFSGTPAVIATMQTTNGGDTATVRWSSHTREQIFFKISEEQSANEETAHTRESVGYMRFSD
ncbi:MAG: fibronectin type III domain-containing protein [Deltaproteobacteria bacterium]|nr:fibronectin type III domain-containing protein [Deltaproteobacteria bacterium]